MTDIDDTFKTELLGQLRQITELLRIGFAEQIREAVSSLGLDAVDKAILVGAQSWIASGELNSQVCEVHGVVPRTVRRRFADLVDAGLLESRGAGRSMEYRAVGMGALV